MLLEAKVRSLDHSPGHGIDWVSSPTGLAAPFTCAPDIANTIIPGRSQVRLRSLVTAASRILRVLTK